MKTLKESIQESPRITKVRLYKTTGEWLGNYDIEEAIQKYGDWLYSSAYSESNTEVSIWIRINTTK
jgi:hypothetical protein